MEPQQLKVLLILAGAVALFISEWLAVDMVAVVLMATLVVTRTVDPTDAFAGLSHPATVTIAAMFILSAGLRRTGALKVVSRQILRWGGGSEASTVLALMVTVGAVSAFINNTAAVAAALPMALRIGRDQGIPASRLLIPVSFAAIFGGTCTLLGTSTNLVVSQVAQRTPGGAFSMFEFTRLGVVLLVVGIAYMATVGRVLLPRRDGDRAHESELRPRHYLTEMIVPAGCPLVGQPLASARLAERDIEVLEVHRGGLPLDGLLDAIVLAEKDILLLWGAVDHVLDLEARLGLAVLAQQKLGEHPFGHREAALVEGIVAVDSVLEGKTIKEINFRGRFGATALAMRRHGEPLAGRLGRVRLRFGDALLIHGPREAIEALQDSPDFVVLEELDPPALRRRRWPVAVGALAGVVVLGALELPWLPIHAAALLAVLALIAGRVMSLREVYKEIDLRVVFLVAALIPLGDAMAETGTARLLAGGILSLCEPLGPLAVLSAFYLVTMLLTEVMSNTAASLLMAQIAVQASSQIGLDSRPILVAVCFAASASFMTPIGYQTNTMVYGPGGYRFLDFTRVGFPLQVLFWLIATALIPVFWPFTAAG